MLITIRGGGGSLFPRGLLSSADKCDMISVRFGFQWLEKGKPIPLNVSEETSGMGSMNYTRNRPPSPKKMNKTTPKCFAQLT